MKRTIIKTVLAPMLSTVLCWQPVFGQSMPDIGFESVGRGAPVDDAQAYPFVGAIEMMGIANAKPTENGEAQAGIEPLAIDIFTTKDFYQDKELWNDPRYYRCNSLMAIESQGGANPGQSLQIDNVAWGYCDRDYPRESIVSPYEFDTAQAHYEALNVETTERGGQMEHTYQTVPGDISGRYVWDEGGLGGLHGTWYSMLLNQVPTIMSLLTDEYKQRVVQETFHQAAGASQWPSQYCWPEGFMRRWHFAATLIQPHTVLVTPDVVQIMAGVAQNFVTNIHMGREFKTDGFVPRLGEDVPRWYGDTIGFWDGDVFITWTSNIQGWMAHSAFEFSSKMQTIEIYTPVRDKNGDITDLNHETIFYDEEALIEPIRLVRNLRRESSMKEGNPYTFIQCIQTIFPVDGYGSPKSPGDEIEFTVPDMYGRPWAEIWSEYHENDMEVPDDEVDIFSFE